MIGIDGPGRRRPESGSERPQTPQKIVVRNAGCGESGDSPGAIRKGGEWRRRPRESRAAHDPVQLPLHFPPLKRRGGSDEPLLPAPISRTLMLALPWPPMPAIGWSAC